LTETASQKRKRDTTTDDIRRRFGSLWTKVDWDSRHNKPRFPPFFVKLPDEWVYLMTKFLPTKTRGVLWRMDFTQNGDVRRERINVGRGVVAWAYGIPWVAASRTGHMLAGGTQQWGALPVKLKDAKDWVFGPAIASRDVLADCLNASG
jgi:hypothetical protein